jgi:hypothetical protein
METPNYFAVIPAPILFDKNLSERDKILFAHIMTLTHKEGFCYASNRYFEQVMDCTDRTISRSLKSLEDNGYIRREMHYREGSKEIENRYIYVSIGMVKNDLTGIDKNDHTGIDKNVLDNSTSNNSINVNSISPVVSPWKEFDKWIDANMIEKWPFRSPKNQIWAAVDKFKKDKKNWSAEQVKNLVIEIRLHLQWYLPQQGDKKMSIANYFDAEKWLEKKPVNGIANNSGNKSAGSKKMQEYRESGF